MTRFTLILFLCFFICSEVVAKDSGASYNVEQNYKFKLAWSALKNGEYNSSIKIADECIDKNKVKAQVLNSQCKDMMRNHSVLQNCYELNVLSGCMFVKIEAHRHLKRSDLMRQVCEEIERFYFNGYVFDPQGQPWKLPMGCKQEIVS